jgi:SAM-dependent methyltransferase
MPRDWNLYYSDAANLDPSPAPLLVEIADRLPPGRALDLACGAGRNALYLARLGWQVTAVDASSTAIARLREGARGLAVDARVADLERREFAIEPDAWDLICDFHYLQRDLFPDIREGVRPAGGVRRLEDPLLFRGGRCEDRRAAGVTPHSSRRVIPCKYRFGDFPFPVSSHTSRHSSCPSGW